MLDTLTHVPARFNLGVLAGRVDRQSRRVVDFIDQCLLIAGEPVRKCSPDVSDVLFSLLLNPSGSFLSGAHRGIGCISPRTADTLLVRIRLPVNGVQGPMQYSQ